MAVDVVTFGCRLNAYESEIIRGQAEAAGLADAIVINTCAVTGEAVRQARQAIRKIRRERPHARLCADSKWLDRKSTRLNSSHSELSRMPSSA